jgi:probable addiction module antidote protein
MKIRQWDAAEFLDNQADIDAYLQVAFESGDPHQITKALGNAAKAKSMLDVANKTGLT